MNWLARKIDAWRFVHQLDARLAARKQARINGQTYVSVHTRRKGTA